MPKLKTYRVLDKSRIQYTKHAYITIKGRKTFRFSPELELLKRARFQRDALRKYGWCWWDLYTKHHYLKWASDWSWVSSEMTTKLDNAFDDVCDNSEEVDDNFDKEITHMFTIQVLRIKTLKKNTYKLVTDSPTGSEDMTIRYGVLNTETGQYEVTNVFGDILADLDNLVNDKYGFMMLHYNIVVAE